MWRIPKCDWLALRVALPRARHRAIGGDHLKPTIMELGGKSPQLVLDDADIELAARGIVSGIFPPAGQSCIAGSRVVVHENRHDELVERVCQANPSGEVGRSNS